MEKTSNVRIENSFKKEVIIFYSLMVFIVISALFPIILMTILYYFLYVSSFMTSDEIMIFIGLISLLVFLSFFTLIMINFTFIIGKIMHARIFKEKYGKWTWDNITSTQRVYIDLDMNKEDALIFCTETLREIENMKMGPQPIAFNKGHSYYRKSFACIVGITFLVKDHVNGGSTVLLTLTTRDFIPDAIRIQYELLEQIPELLQSGTQVRKPSWLKN